ncbi:hypothetical protein SynA15127_01008 [Synechococcus sp. A15-127]|nr:hypothetical protein SynA15127_01008 [Synechococcus sp. A15-127]
MQFCQEYCNFQNRCSAGILPDIRTIQASSLSYRNAQHF